jgi:histidine ammonia-lyase
MEEVATEIVKKDSTVTFSLNYFRDVLFNEKKIALDDDSLKKVEDCFSFLNEFSNDKLIYGITTGFGPMAQYRITDKDRIALQYNLIRSHCSGAGNHIPPLYVKAGMICRLSNILKAKSGIHPECAILLKDFINNDIIPVVYEHGGVGASGDLVQLSHLALSMIGEGEVYFRGKIVTTAEAMTACNLKPISIRIREGLSLINGTSIMTGVSVVNLLYAKNLFNWSLMASAIINEIVDSFDDSFSEELNSVKLHKGQNEVAAAMRTILKDSQLIKKRENHLYNRKVTETVLKEKVQEYYSLRCVPQVLGAIYDTIGYSEQVVINEANSVNDNPVVDPETKNVYHGGNFHGDYISLEMDKLKIVVTKMTMLAERQLNYLLNSRLNEKFAPFVNLGVIGLNLGMQGVQFTATSTTAECQTLSFPNYVHSIPNNNDNQDIVSMGTNSALITRKVIENSYEVLAIFYIALIQGIDNIGVQNKMSSQTKAVYDSLRKRVPVFVEDTTKYKDILLVKEYLMKNETTTSK